MARALNPGGLEQVILLALIHLGGDHAYGLSIHEHIQERTGKFLNPAAVYITLDRLLKKGYVVSRLGDPTPERGGRAKRFFKITGLGEKALRESFATMTKMAGELKTGLEAWKESVT